MKNFKIQQAILTTIISVACVGLSNASAQTQTPANTVCKTGSDVDLPEIKSKVANMAEDLKRLKQVKQNSRAGASVLRSEILAIDQELGPWRARHKIAAEQAGETVDTYAVYKAEWIDTGELERLNATINLLKTKHQDYKQARAQYSAENTEFKALGTKYQHIARDLLDRDRDCAAAIMALE
jgi:Zn-finger nucleic acid-binding protein